MSSNTARNGGSGKNGRGAGVGDTTLPVRWVVLFTGSTATDDYQPFASAGEPDGLIREVAKMCVDFHPHSEIRLFPKDRETYLFWRAKTTSDWVITRVSTAPNPEGLRVALEYASIVLSDSDFALLRYNPFRTRPLNLHDRVRQQFLSGKYEPFDYALAPEVLPGGSATESGPADKPKISADSLSTPENFQALQQFCSRPIEPPAPPPTFATWWASGGPIPEGYFDIVLRAAAPRAASLREVVQGSTTLVAELKEAMPSVPASDNVAGELTRSILDNANQVASGVAGAADRINSDTPDQFRENLATASRQSGQIATDLATLTRRLGTGLAVAERERLLLLSEQYENLGQELPKVRHPNPFSNNLAANRPATPVATVDRSSDRPASGGMKPQFIAIPVIIAGIALAAWKLAPTAKPAADTTAPPVAIASPAPVASVAPAASASPAPVASAAPAADPTLALLQKAQPDILESARQKAHDTARTAAAKGVDLSQGAIDKITVNAIKGAYKGTLDAPTYASAFVGAGGKAWTYSQFAQKLPALAPAVHEGATVGATEGAADSKVKIAEAEAASARLAAEAARKKPTPEPAPTPRASRKSRDNGDNGDTPKASKPKEKPREKPAEKPREKPKEKPREKPAAPKTGSADKTGL